MTHGKTTLGLRSKILSGKKLWYRNINCFITTLLFIVGLSVLFYPLHISANWYNNLPIIHGCGEHEGFLYTNCKEALIKALKSSDQGRSIEIDFSFTKDDVLVCAHDFFEFNRRINDKDIPDPPLFKDFKKAGTAGGGTVMTASEAVKIMDEYPNAYLIVDTKKCGIELYSRLVRICKRLKKEGFLDRMVIQVYAEDEYEEIRKIYAFKHWCFSAYKYEDQIPEVLQTLVTFCKTNKFDALVIPAAELSYDPEDVDLKHFILNEAAIQKISCGKEIPVICHTVNDDMIYRKLLDNGITNVFTDSIDLGNEEHLQNRNGK